MERKNDQALRLNALHPAPQDTGKSVFLRHPAALAGGSIATAIALTAPWWWQKLAAVPLASMVAAVSIATAREADRHRALLAAIVDSLEPTAPPPPGLVPYIDPVRASNRTGQVVYQFVRPHLSTGETVMLTTLEQLIASFLQVGLAKIDTKLSPSTQQAIDTAVPTLVSTIASVIVDLADNHKAVKTSAIGK